MRHFKFNQYSTLEVWNTILVVCVSTIQQQHTASHPNFVFLLPQLCAFFSLLEPANLFARCGSIKRAIILNGKIKGLQSSSVIQLSVTCLIRTWRRGDGEMVSEQEEARKVNVSYCLDSTRHPKNIANSFSLRSVWN